MPDPTADPTPAARTPAARTPAEVVTELIHRMAARDYEAALKLYGDEVVVSVEFALPQRVEMTRDDLVRGLSSPQAAGMLRMYEDLAIEDLRVHETADPEVVIAEWNYRSRVGDETVLNPNIIVVGVRNGQLFFSRDYHNDVTRAVANGLLPELIERLPAMALEQDLA